MKNALIEIKVTRAMKHTIIAYAAILVCVFAFLIVLLYDQRPGILGLLQ